MKAKINGIEIEGTPKEFKQFLDKTHHKEIVIEKKTKYKKSGKYKKKTGR